jgi:hypothetical protein
MNPQKHNVEEAFPRKVTNANARAAMESYIHQILPYPEHYQGRGIVMCAGGPLYFTNAWVCINMLRHLGCALPIEIWHLGVDEMDDTMRALAATLGAECIDAEEMRKQHPMRVLKGWELKPYAILHSKFREVIYLDADNVPVQNPELLFETPQYQQHRAIFWPDFGRLPAQHPAWALTGVPYRDEPEFETGQLVVDKQTCWRELCLTVWINSYSDFYYNIVHGDKETFHLAWRKMEREYAIVPHPVTYLERAIFLQHDFSGAVLFQHRVYDKWKYDGSHRPFQAFQFREACESYLAALRQQWDGKLQRPRHRPFDPNDPASVEMGSRLSAYGWYYDIKGANGRPIVFLENGQIGEGAGELEQFWNISTKSGQYILKIYSDKELTMELTSRLGNQWVGRWLVWGKGMVELQPIWKHWASEKAPQTKDLADAKLLTMAKQLFDEQWIYHIRGIHTRNISFKSDGTVANGKGELEQMWNVYRQEETYILDIYSAETLTMQMRTSDGINWRGNWLVRDGNTIELTRIPSGKPLALTHQNVRREIELFISQIPTYPGGFQGRGIVICGGGLRLFPSAWVCIRILRLLGNQLPIELWHLGPEEIDSHLESLVAPYNVTCIDAIKVKQHHPSRILNGWELKAYSILHSSFQEVLFLDADNFPLVDPTYLFDAPEYVQKGAILWPDRASETFKAEHPIWSLLGIPYRNEPAVESGQLLINKALCWSALNTTMWINEYSDFFYQFLYGDKDTFHFGWRKVAKDYAQPAKILEDLVKGVMLQHDFQDQRIFQHRHGFKWNLLGENPKIQGFMFEEECHNFIKELREKWDGKVHDPNKKPLSMNKVP